MHTVNVIVRKVLGATSAALLAAMLIVVSGQVVMRYVFRVPFTWGEELARFLQIWLTFTGATLAFVSGGHATIRMLVERLGDRAQKVAQGVVAAAMAGFFLVLALKGVRLVAFAWTDESPALSLPYGMVYLALPVSSAIICVLQLATLWRLVRGGGAVLEPQGESGAGGAP